MYVLQESNTLPETLPTDKIFLYVKYFYMHVLQESNTLPETLPTDKCTISCEHMRPNLGSLSCPNLGIPSLKKEEVPFLYMHTHIHTHAPTSGLSILSNYRQSVLAGSAEEGGVGTISIYVHTRTHTHTHTHIKWVHYRGSQRRHRAVFYIVLYSITPCKLITTHAHTHIKWVHYRGSHRRRVPRSSCPVWRTRC